MAHVAYPKCSVVVYETASGGRRFDPPTGCVDLEGTEWGAKGWCPTLAVAMPDEVFWPGQSHRDHVMRVAEQAQARAKAKAESSKKIPRLSDQEFSFFNTAYNPQPLPPLATGVRRRCVGHYRRAGREPHRYIFSTVCCRQHCQSRAALPIRRTISGWNLGPSRCDHRRGAPTSLGRRGVGGTVKSNALVVLRFESSRPNNRQLGRRTL